MALTKAKAADTVPFAPSDPSPVAPALATVSEAKSLTIKLSGTQYTALREYCIAKERETGKRPSHQAVLVEAFEAFVGANVR